MESGSTKLRDRVARIAFRVRDLTLRKPAVTAPYGSLGIDDFTLASRTSRRISLGSDLDAEKWIAPSREAQDQEGALNSAGYLALETPSKSLEGYQSKESPNDARQRPATY